MPQALSLPITAFLDRTGQRLEGQSAGGGAAHTGVNNPPRRPAPPLVTEQDKKVENGWDGVATEGT